ncbi:hypothetical protein DVH24_005062 [Malus domestica]|uniref:Uncharacterized protein n=1 Tax=Malus domestica TaxID=3750 RepID=A0A498IBK7_MALDO|nr:hypothetical protein DVH24_005062 [Malus domestica]
MMPLLFYSGTSGRSLSTSLRLTMFIPKIWTPNPARKQRFPIILESLQSKDWHLPRGWAGKKIKKDQKPNRGPKKQRNEAVKPNLTKSVFKVQKPNETKMMQTNVVLKYTY